MDSSKFNYNLSIIRNQNTEHFKKQSIQKALEERSILSGMNNNSFLYQSYNAGSTFYNHMNHLSHILITQPDP